MEGLRGVKYDRQGHIAASFRTLCTLVLSSFQFAIFLSANLSFLQIIFGAILSYVEFYLLNCGSEL